MQLPIGAENDFKGVVDLIEHEGLRLGRRRQGRQDVDVAKSRPTSRSKAAEYRAAMIEAAVEMDDDAMDAYLDGKEPDEDTLRSAIRKATVTRAFYPMMCGSAFKNKGVQPLLDAVVDFLPSPADREAYKGIDRKTGAESCAGRSTSEPLSMIAFKIMSFEHVGSITFCRIYSGKLEQGHGARNTTRDKKERVGRMYLMHAADREEIKEAFAGDIVALSGLKDTRTGETLCDPQKPVLLEKMDFPDPVIEMKIEPKTKADQEKMAMALSTLALEDPSFRVSVDQESGETILKGMGELHLDIKVDILKRTLRRRSQRRRAAGCLSRDARARGRDRLHAQEADRRHGPVRARQAAARAQRDRQGQRVRERSRRRHGAEGVHPGRREGHQVGVGLRRPHRLPDGRHQGRRCTTAPSTRSTRRPSPSKSPRGRR